MRQHCVLVCDDDPAILNFLQEVLTDEGYTVCTATNGRDGLELMRDNQVDLVLLDLMMPIMNGWEFAEEWNKLPADQRPPVIVLSADRNVVDKAKALNLTTGVSKPFMLDQLLDLVASYVAPEAA